MKRAAEHTAQNRAIAATSKRVYQIRASMQPGNQSTYTYEAGSWCLFIKSVTHPIYRIGFERPADISA
jgi:hypothetical protein